MISTSFFDSSTIKWEPCSDPLPEHPHMARILDGLEKGLSFNQAAWGKGTAAAMARIQASVEKRNPWRSPLAYKGESLPSPVSRWLRNTIAHWDYIYTQKPHLKTTINIGDIQDEVIGQSSKSSVVDFVGDWGRGRSFSDFHIVKPYVSEIYRRVMRERDCYKADEILEGIERRLTLSGSAGLGSLMLTQNEEKLSSFAKKTASYLWGLICAENAEIVSISFVINKRTGETFTCDFPSKAALYVINNYLGYSSEDVAEKCHVARGYGLEPFINRLKSPDFILRRFRAIKRLALADFLREYGFVNRAREAFVSDILVSDRKFQKQRNQHLMDNMVVYDVNNLDNFHLLADMVSKSTNNADNRFYELLARFKGFAEYAEEFGFQGGMFTLTTPSRFHAFSTNGQPNQKWLKADKPTAQDGAQWLSHSWALVQSRLAKCGIKLFGFRFCEPHHDGTIHYHIAAWFNPCHKKTVIKTFQAVMLMEKEKGALKRRFNYLLADKEKGAKGMIGYFLPYISKNTNGRKLSGHDELAPVDPAASCEKDASPVDRVDSWKSSYRFRQFSQIGGPSVTAWREMRRIRSEFNKDSSMFKHLTQAEWFALESVRAAADAGDWKQFCIAMGGVSVKRKDQTISIKYETPKAFEKILENLDKEFTKEFKKTRYGDTAKARVAGINFPYIRQIVDADSDSFALKSTMYALFVKTRTTEWCISDKKQFEKMKSRSLEFVSDQFDQLILSGDYQVMDEDVYSRYLELVDEENSLFQREILLDSGGIPSDWVPVFDDYLGSNVVDDFDFPVWAFADDVQGAALN